MTLMTRPFRRWSTGSLLWRVRHNAALDFVIKHHIKGIVGGGSATMAEFPIVAYRDAARRAGLDWQLGEIAIGVLPPR